MKGLLHEYNIMFVSFLLQAGGFSGFLHQYN